MSGWLIAAVVVLAVVIGLVFVPLRIRLNVQGRGEPDGFWALAGGVALGPLAGSGLGARGVEPAVQVHLFGRSVYKRTLGELLAKKERKEEAEESTKQKVERALERAKSGYDKLERRLDPLDLALFVVRERRRVRVERLVVELEYSFADITTTGKLLGAIHAFSAVLPPEVEIYQSPSWDDVDRGNFSGSGTIKFWPGLLLVDAGIYLIRNVRVRSRPRSAKEAT